MSVNTQKKSESDTSGKLTPVSESRRDREYQEFLTGTADMPFVKEPVACARAQMDDDLAAPYSRVFAWVRVNSWGRMRLYCRTEDGIAARQLDCAKALNIHKGTVSKAFKALADRGMIEIRDNRIFPTLAPVLKPLPDPDKEDPYSDFVVKWWRSSNPELSRQLDAAAALDTQANALRKQAREIRRAIEPVVKNDYEHWKATGKVSAQQHLPGSIALSRAKSASAGSMPDPATVREMRTVEVAARQPVTQLMPVAAAPPAELAPPETPVSDAPPAELQRPESPPIREDLKTLKDEQTPKRRPSVAVRTQVKNCLKSHARSFPELPQEPDDAIVEAIASHIPDQAVFTRFASQVRKTAIRGRRLETWAYFEPVARVALLNETKPAAPSESETPPDKIPPQSEEEMILSLKAAGIPDEELAFFRAKVEQDRARRA